jgi:hypothetical protein
MRVMHAANSKVAASTHAAVLIGTDGCEVLASDLTHAVVLQVRLAVPLMQAPQTAYVIVPANADVGTSVPLITTVPRPLRAYLRVHACSIACRVDTVALSRMGACTRRRFWRYTGESRHARLHTPVVAHGKPGNGGLGAIPPALLPDPPATSDSAGHTCAWCGVAYPTPSLYAAACSPNTRLVFSEP